MASILALPFMVADQAMEAPSSDIPPLQVSLVQGLVITNPLNSSHLNVTTVTVSWHLTGSGALVNHYLVRVDEGTWVNNSLRTNIPLIILREGWHSVEVQAWTEFGPEFADEVTFEMDITPPQVASHSPTGNQTALSSTISIGFSEDMDRASVALTGMTGHLRWSNRNLTLTPDEQLLPGQYYDISVNGKDLAGNQLGDFSWRFRATDQGSVTGQVKDEHNNTIADAEVELDMPGRTVRTKTDPEGNFLLSAPAGRYNLTISSSSIVTKVLEVNISVGETLELDVIEVSLVPDYTWLLIDVVVIVGAAAFFIMGSRRQRMGRA